MVDWYGRWYEEPDYSTYPEEEWCDYDRMAVWIRKQKYVIKTSMENLITMVFSFFDWELWECYRDLPEDYVERCKQYVEDSGGLAEFDYWL